MDLSRLFPDMSPALKRYYWRSALPSLVFVLLTAARIPVLQGASHAGAWRFVVGLLPLLAWFWMLYEYMRFLRECDELERRIELGALVAAMGVSVSAAMTLLFVLDVQPMDLHPQRIVALAVVVPIAVFAIARHVLHRRYR